MSEETPHNVPKNVQAAFKAFCSAVILELAALVTCYDKETGEPVYIGGVSIPNKDNPNEAALIPMFRFEPDRDFAAEFKPPEGATTQPTSQMLDRLNADLSAHKDVVNKMQVEEDLRGFHNVVGKALAAAVMSTMATTTDEGHG